MWQSMSNEARAEYGEDYFEQAVRSLETYTKGEVSSCNCPSKNTDAFS